MIKFLDTIKNISKGSQMAILKKNYFVQGNLLIKFLENHGWTVKKVKGVHYEMMNSLGRRLNVPVHNCKKIPNSTQMAIKKTIFVKNHSLPNYKLILDASTKNAIDIV